MRTTTELQKCFICSLNKYLEWSPCQQLTRAWGREHDCGPACIE